MSNVLLDKMPYLQIKLSNHYFFRFELHPAYIQLPKIQNLLMLLQTTVWGEGLKRERSEVLKWNYSKSLQ